MLLASTLTLEQAFRSQKKDKNVREISMRCQNGCAMGSVVFGFSSRGKMNG